MISGTFDPTYRRPYVRGRLALPGLHLDDYIYFLVDTGADTTTIYPRDALRMGIDYDKLSPVEVPQYGVGGIEYASEEHANIFFQDGRSIRTYTILVSVPRPTEHNIRLPSLLGQDIIQYWRMVHDKRRDRLTFTVRRADLTLRSHQ